MSNNNPEDRMRSLIEKYYLKNRIPVGNDTSQFVRELADEIDADVLSIPSGQECLTWIIPPEWVVHEAYLETMTGKRIADFNWHPMYLKSYSAPFSGKVSRDQLIDNILFDEKRPDSIIYDYRLQYQYGERLEWGFSLPYRIVKTLSDDYYQVNIVTEFKQGTLDILDLIIPGDIPDTIFIAAHTCHPGQVNDGIAAIAVIFELIHWLKKKSTLRYTYRIILGPEYFAAAGILDNGKDVDKLKYGIFFDMLGNGKPLGFSHSFTNDSYFDKITHNVFKHNSNNHFERSYRGLWGNDELFYDGPDFQIPTLCIGRDRFDNYHTNMDNLENCDFAQLKESFLISKKIINVLETDEIPKRLYRGPLYLNRFNLYIDPKKDRKGYNNLQNIQILADGTKSCLEIADALDIDYEFVRTFFEKLCKENLLSFRDPYL